MKHAILALALAAGPAFAQDSTPTPPAEAPPSSTMEEGFRMFMDGLRDEVEPAVRDLRGLAGDAAPLMRQFQDRLGDVVDDLDVYEAPEIQPNGDILIRRKEPLPVEEPGADGAVDL